MGASHGDDRFCLEHPSMHKGRVALGSRPVITFYRIAFSSEESTVVLQRALHEEQAETENNSRAFKKEDVLLSFSFTQSYWACGKCALYNEDKSPLFDLFCSLSFFVAYIPNRSRKECQVLQRSPHVRHARHENAVYLRHSLESRSGSHEVVRQEERKHKTNKTACVFRSFSP